MSMDADCKSEGKSMMDGKKAASKKSFKQSKNAFHPSSPTDTMLSPISQRLLRKGSRGPGKAPIPENVGPWNPPDHIRIILGSSSKARQDILASADWKFSTMSPDIDEKAVSCNDPMRRPALVAKAKATAILDQLDDLSKETIVITCDQITVYNNEIREKPVDESEARRFLQTMSGEAIRTISAVVATHLPSRRQCTDVDMATVHWKPFTTARMQQMIEVEDVFHSCGGFVVEHDSFAEVIDRIEGDIDSVRGLPMKTTIRVVKSVLCDSI